jgi:hypothetical protein
MFSILRRVWVVARRNRVRITDPPFPIVDRDFAAAEVANNFFGTILRFALRAMM